MGEGFEGGEGEFLGERVDACVFEELRSVVVDGGGGRVGFEPGVAGGEPSGEVFACVLVLQEAAYGVEGFVAEGDLSL